MKQLAIITVAVLIISGQLSAQQKEKLERKDMENITPPKISDFPVGEENTAYAKYFTGKSWNAPLTVNKELNVPINNITFEPGCRNNWHSHSGGQVLVAVGGVGYYQERGKKAVRMQPGDVVEIGENVEHWHGAAPESWFSHLAITANSQNNENTWHEPVSDKDYSEAVKK